MQLKRQLNGLVFLNKKAASMYILSLLYVNSYKWQGMQNFSGSQSYPKAVTETIELC